MKTKVKLISNRPDEYITLDSVVDGPGLRFVLWFQGCAHNCEKCHNPQTHSFNKGSYVDIEELKKQIKLINDEEIYDGITFSGGDPIYQIDALEELTKYCEEIGLNVWVYTGFKFEEFDSIMIEKLKHIDVLVDGPFLIEEKSLDILYRGSKNQRLIDVKETINNNEIILKTI